MTARSTKSFSRNYMKSWPSKMRSLVDSIGESPTNSECELEGIRLSTDKENKGLCPGPFQRISIMTRSRFIIEWTLVHWHGLSFGVSREMPKECVHLPLISLSRHLAKLMYKHRQVIPQTFLRVMFMFFKHLHKEDELTRIPRPKCCHQSTRTDTSPSSGQAIFHEYTWYKRDEK